MAQNDPDASLVLRLQSGEDDALNELMTRHQERIHRFIWRYIPNEHDAVELTQETFVRAYFNITKFKPHALFSTWLFSIALNLCRDHVRAKNYRFARASVPLSHHTDEDPRVAVSELRSNEPTPAENLQRQEKMQVLTEAIDALPHDLKAPFILGVLEQLSHKECATRLNITEKAVEMKIYRARKILAKKIARL